MRACADLIFVFSRRNGKKTQFCKRDTSDDNMHGLGGSPSPLRTGKYAMACGTFFCGMQRGNRRDHTENLRSGSGCSSTFHAVMGISAYGSGSPLFSGLGLCEEHSPRLVRRDSIRPGTSCAVHCAFFHLRRKPPDIRVFRCAPEHGMQSGIQRGEKYHRLPCFRFSPSGNPACLIRGRAAPGYQKNLLRRSNPRHGKLVRLIAGVPPLPCAGIRAPPVLFHLVQLSSESLRAGD